jgi:hypothetical protein
LHRPLSQEIGVWAGQLPWPSHTDLLLSELFEQLWSAQTVVLSKVQAALFDGAQTPAHLPEPPQDVRGAEVKLQVPVTHDSQFPSHLLSQQWPSTQKPVAHSFLLEHVPAPCGLHAPEAQ